MGKRVLLVDSDTSVLFAYQNFLNHNGFQLDAVSSREEAVEMLLRNQYCFAIIDLKLSSNSGREGFELISLARQYQPDIKVITVTAVCDPEIEKEALALGTDYYLEKPVSVHMIRKLIETPQANPVFPRKT